MVVCTVGAVATVATGGVGALAGAALGTTAGTGAATTGTAAAVATATGIGTSGGAIAGASTGIGGAVAGAVAGGTSAAGVGGSGAGLAALTLGTGGWGLLAVGTDVSAQGQTNRVTFDCWKPVIRDTSTAPSDGMRLCDLMNHANIAQAVVTQSQDSDLPDIVLENIWKERFAIQYLVIPDTGTLACHAQLLC